MGRYFQGLESGYGIPEQLMLGIRTRDIGAINAENPDKMYTFTGIRCKKSKNR
jgi:hypothetical protein